jgi:hypothetical protein
LKGSSDGPKHAVFLREQFGFVLSLASNRTAKLVMGRVVTKITGLQLGKNLSMQLRTLLVPLRGWGVNNARPRKAQLRERGPAPVFIKETSDAPIGAVETPFVPVAMLEDPSANEIMLAHCLIERLYSLRGHRIRHLKRMPGHLKSCFVAMNMSIIVVRMLVRPHCQQ